MISKSVHKIPNGKLIKVVLNYNAKNKKILGLKITGDFFVYPEEAIEILENKLINTALNEITLKDIIENIKNENKIEFIGLDIEGLVTGILKCLK
jgi:small-conductance mechanosensitive channel